MISWTSPDLSEPAGWHVHRRGMPHTWSLKGWILVHLFQPFTPPTQSNQPNPQSPRAPRERPISPQTDHSPDPCSSHTHYNLPQNSPSPHPTPQQSTHRSSQYRRRYQSSSKYSRRRPSAPWEPIGQRGSAREPRTCQPPAFRGGEKIGVMKPITYPRKCPLVTRRPPPIQHPRLR